MVSGSFPCSSFTWSLVFLHTFMKVSAREADIVYITQFHRRNEWRVDFIQRWQENRGWWSIEIQAEKAFYDNCFNRKYAHNITKKKTKQKKNTFSQFAGNLYEQVDRVTMGSPLVLLMVNAFMCHIEENWETKTRCLCFLLNTEWNPPPLSVSQWNLRTTTDFPFLEWWLSETVSDQTRRSTGNQLILEFYDVTKAMMKQP